MESSSRLVIYLGRWIFTCLTCPMGYPPISATKQSRRFAKSVGLQRFMICRGGRAKKGGAGWEKM